MVFKEKRSIDNKSSVSNKKKTIRVGDVGEFTITALGLRNIGIDEYSLGYSVLIPNAKLGEKVKAKILKINLKENKYAIAKPLETIKKSEVNNVPLNPGDFLEVNISKLSYKGAGMVELANNYKLIIPNATLGEKIGVVITRVKSNYGFGKMMNESNSSFTQTPSDLNKPKLVQGSKFTLNIPKNAKQYGKYAIVRFQGSVVFVKLALNAKPGDKVRVKLTKVNNKFAIGQILLINPSSLLRKRALVQNSIREMLKNGMHFGEKAVKCNAKMKNYIWLRKQGQNKNRPVIKKGRHIINLLKTRRCLNKALTQLGKYAIKGRTFLFIGTKKPAAGLIARASLFSKTSFFVNTRWLGGMLTNWKTILKSISKIRPILKEKQKIVRDILEKRQNIKARLIKKALLLKKKSKLILNKGRQLIESFKNDTQATVKLAKKAAKLSLKRKELIQNGHELLEKRQILLEKRKELMLQSQILKDKGIQVALRYKSLLNQLTASSKKLTELKYLLILSKEIKAIKNLANQQEKNIFSVSYGKLKELNTTSTPMPWVIPNPPKELLNRIVLTIYGQTQNAERNKIKAKSNSNKKVLVLSKLISKFSRFAPYIKSLIKVVQGKIKTIENLCNSDLNQLTKIKTILKNNIELKNELIVELKLIKSKLNSERNIIRLVKRKLNHFASQKRLIKFLPRLRYLPTPQTKIADTVQILMKKIVDPKLKYPIDNIYEEKLSTNSKKLAAARKKKWQRLERYFGGIANMTKMSKSKIYKNIAIVIGQKEEINAVRECKKLGIKMFNVVDTNCNPTFADHIIPANDDSRNSIKYILNKFLVRIRLAQKIKKALVSATK
jgi:ribosomal protein S2